MTNMDSNEYDATEADFDAAWAAGEQTQVAAPNGVVVGRAHGNRLYTLTMTFGVVPHSLADASLETAYNRPMPSREIVRTAS